MLENVFAYPTMLMAGVFIVFGTSIMLIIVPLISAKSMGGRLGIC